MSERQTDQAAVGLEAMVQERVREILGYYERDGQGYYAFTLTGKKTAIYRADFFDRALEMARERPLPSDSFLP